MQRTDDRALAKGPLGGLRRRVGAYHPVHLVEAAAGAEGDDDALTITEDLIVCQPAVARIQVVVRDWTVTRPLRRGRLGADMGYHVLVIIARLLVVQVQIVVLDGHLQRNASRAERREAARITVVRTEVSIVRVECDVTDT